MRCLYADLDGTLLGAGASLLRDGAGNFELLGVRALEACHRAGVELVLCSGRRRALLAEDARLLGAPAYIFELGGGVALDGEVTWLTAPFAPGERTVYEQVAALGAPALLAERFAGRLAEEHTWEGEREVSHMFRGLVDVTAAQAALAHAGMAGVRLVDNGESPIRPAALDDLPEARLYHLVPEGTSKAAAVRAHMRARGYDPEDCVAVGDSGEDMRLAAVVGTFWLMANALDREPGLVAATSRASNVRVAEAGHGAGVYEAVVRTLAERR